MSAIEHHEDGSRTRHEVGYVGYYTDPDGRQFLGHKCRSLEQLRREYPRLNDPGFTIRVEKITIDYKYEWVELDEGTTHE